LVWVPSRELDAVMTAIGGSADGDRFVARDDGSIAVIDPTRTSGLSLSGIEPRPWDDAMINLSGDGRVMARWIDREGEPKRLVSVSDALSGLSIREVQPREPDGFLTAGLSPDGTALFTLHESGRLVRTELEDGTETAVGTYDVSEVPAFARLAVAADGTAAAVGETGAFILAADGSVRRVDTGGWGGADFSPDGTRLYVASYDAGMIHVIDVATGTVTGTIATGGRPTFLDVDGAGTRLLVNNVDFDEGSRLDLYSLPDGAGLGSLEIRQQASAVRIEEATGGTTAITSGPGLDARWDIDPASWLRRACELSGRNLTETEWSNHLGDEPFAPTCPEHPTFGATAP
jgi:YVTN family beta-propeller protein